MQRSSQSALSDAQPSERRRSVLVLAENFPSRIQPWLLSSLEYLLQRGVEVTIAANRALGSTYPEKVERLGLLQSVRYLPASSVSDVLRGCRPYLVPFTRGGQQAYRGLFRLLASERGKPRGATAWAKAIVRAPLLGGGRFDLVHAHNLSAAYEYRGVAEALGIPLVATFHGLTPKGGVNRLPEERAQELFQRGSRFFVNSRFAQGQLEWLGCPGEKIRVLPEGLPLQEYPFRARPFPSPVRLILMTVARLSPDKGLRYAIGAIAGLRKMGLDVEYRLVGTGPQKAELSDLVQELGVGEQVKFLGEVTDAELGRQYQEAHIFILPSVPDPSGNSHVETQGVVIQEAQASGVLVVAARTGGIPECVDDGRSAFLVPPQDAEALAQKLAWLIDHGDSWLAWQREARAWVESHFAMELVGERLWAHYSELWEPPPGRQTNRQAIASGVAP